jgi:hypothetical protein
MVNVIPARNQELIWRNLDGEAVLLNPVNGKYFGMNEVSCSFWEKVDGKKTLADIIDLLLEEYNVERKTLENDITELTVLLEENDIITIKR